MITTTNKAKENLKAWDNLYKSTSQSVWGDAPVGFLNDFLPELNTHLNPASKILDAGTGEGRNLPSILRMQGLIYAVDGSESALNKIPEPVKKKVKCMVAMLDAIPHDSDYFDLIIGIDIMETLPNITEVLNEFCRLLKPGGLLLCNIPTKEDTICGVDMLEDGEKPDAFLYQNKYFYKFYSVEEAEAMLLTSGFEIATRKKCRWVEEPHPNFRAETHEHVSEVYLARKK
ncbi:MAG: class I SAM-dependent methyltransferase [Balneolales bacterium]|nr:class I SAM-dependent methyltransferase [Balneolales bacterium]